jgi:hypothetical protein
MCDFPALVTAISCNGIDKTDGERDVSVFCFKVFQEREGSRFLCAASQPENGVELTVS